MEVVISVAVLVGLALVIGGIITTIYNSLVKQKVRVDESWSGITIQIKRRADLLPNLIETVKGYATHESQVFDKLTKARANTLSQEASPSVLGKAESEMQNALKTMFAVAEDYPVLQASANFLNLQSELTDTEDKIMASRRYYNGSVREYNTKIQHFPSNLVAKSFKFTKAEFFDVPNANTIANPPTIAF